MKTRGGGGLSKMAFVSYEYGTLAIEVCLFLISPSSFLQRISVSAKYKQIICHDGKIKKINIQQQRSSRPSYFSLYHYL
jgi:hypothetical protein